MFYSNRKDRRFLVIDVLQLILVEPDSKRLGWGVVRFVGFLQVYLLTFCFFLSVSFSSVLI